MEDKQEVLKEFGIVDEKWTDGVSQATTAPLNLPPPLQTDTPYCNPRKSDFNPYIMVSALLQNLDIGDLASAQMALSNSLNDSKIERERLVRHHFSTYVKCRSLLDEAAFIKRKLDATKALDQGGSFKVLQSIVAPLQHEYKELYLKEKQVQFMNDNIILFEGPEVLEEHLNTLDYASFLSDYSLAKNTADRYRGSNFVSFLWSRFIKVVSRFKIEISRRIELSTNITQSIHYFNIYLQVDPHSAGMMFGTFLMVAKKEFYLQLELLTKQSVPRGNPGKDLVSFVEQITGAFIFMTKSMASVEFVYNRDKQMEEFTNSALEAVSQTTIKAIDALYPRDRPGFSGTGSGTQFLSVVKKALTALKRAGAKVEGASVGDVLENSHLAPLKKRLVKLLWADAHGSTQSGLLELLRDTILLFGISGDVSKQATKTVRKLVKTYEAAEPEESLKQMLVLRCQTIPEMAKLLKDDFAALKDELVQTETAAKRRVTKQLQKALARTSTPEEYLMTILRIKTVLTLAQVSTSAISSEIIKIAISGQKLTYLLSYYLQSYGGAQPQEYTTEEKKHIASFSKQLSFLREAQN
ncbi:hypothetical protein NEDG_01764 [Nematocida displodere]|uniref:Exocyst complex component EXOC2/Sec5 N-terminal domain-containing protein n=1 Tax=Nematocida displodere TaxID=1805483 RepID=A0A177EFB5_9MICR|nr:hypothetical protein NEDG_01764 [Nematocida displodere]